MPPKVYDSNSPDEAPVPLPSSPPIELNRDILIQPPLTRRGIGPGLIIFLPDPSKLGPSTEVDPEPVMKWAEEGFAVAGVTVSGSDPDFSLILRQCCDALSALDQINNKETFGVLSKHEIHGNYDPS
jgi:carboxymethylenebutenolidase